MMPCVALGIAMGVKTLRERKVTRAFGQGITPGEIHAVDVWIDSILYTTKLLNLETRSCTLVVLMQSREEGGKERDM